MKTKLEHKLLKLVKQNLLFYYQSCNIRYCNIRYYSKLVCNIGLKTELIFENEVL